MFLLFALHTHTCGTQVLSATHLYCRLTVISLSLIGLVEKCHKYYNLPLIGKYSIHGGPVSETLYHTESNIIGSIIGTVSRNIPNVYAMCNISKATLKINCLAIIHFSCFRSARTF